MPIARGMHSHLASAFIRRASFEQLHHFGVPGASAGKFTVSQK